MNSVPRSALALMEHPERAAAPAKVLVIHQAREARNALDRDLRGRFEVRKADSGEAGWQAVLVDPAIRAVVANLAVLELDGYGLLQRVRGSKIARIRSLPILIVAGRDEASLADLARSFGASDVAPPGIDAAGLRTRIEALIDPRVSGGRGVADWWGYATSTTTTAHLIGIGRAAAAGTAVLPPAVHAVAPHVPDAIHDKPETSMARFDSLNKVLSTLQSSSPGVEASALISSDGLMIASALSQDFDETRVAGMTATLLNLGSRAATELKRGEVSEVIVRGEQGYAVMISAGRGALLLVLAKEATPLGLIFFDMREAIKSIKTIL